MSTPFRKCQSSLYTSPVEYPDIMNQLIQRIVRLQGQWWNQTERESSLTEPKVEIRKQTATLEQLKQWVWRVPCVVRFCAEGTINRVTSWIIMASFLVQIFSQVLSNSSSQIETLEGLSALNVFSRCSCLQPSVWVSGSFPCMFSTSFHADSRLLCS